MVERAIGDRQVIVHYDSAAWNDTTGKGLSEVLLGIVGDDAEARSLEGWRITAWDTATTRFMGTLANMTFDTGGSYVTEVVVTVVYSRA